VSSTAAVHRKAPRRTRGERNRVMSKGGLGSQPGPRKK
jgi:hypothetical protein